MNGTERIRLWWVAPIREKTTTEMYVTARFNRFHRSLVHCRTRKENKSLRSTVHFTPFRRCIALIIQSQFRFFSLDWEREMSWKHERGRYCNLLMH